MTSAQKHLVGASRNRSRGSVAVAMVAGILAVGCESPPKPPDAVEIQGSGASCTQARPQVPRSVLDDPKFKSATISARVEILPSGTVDSVTILRSSGYPSLDAAVADALRQTACSFRTPPTERIVAEQEFTFQTRLSWQLH